MKRLVIADAHVGQRAGDVAEMQSLLFHVADAGFGEVVYLGDAFQYLIGMSKFWTSCVQEVLGTWDRIRQRGVRVAVIEGNRDFFLDHPDLGDHLDWAGSCYHFQAGSRRYRLVHGDKVNHRDFQYLFWSRVSKSAVARAWARLLPRSVAVAIVNHMEKRLAATNRRFRYRKPLADLRREADAAWQDGVDTLLWGHFHTPWTYSRDDRLAMVVPAWMDCVCAMSVDEDGSWVMVDRALTPCDRLPRMG